MAKKATDAFANIAAIHLHESGVDTLTTAKFAFPFSIMDKMALVISRIEYELINTGIWAATADRICVALTTAATPPDIEDVTDPQIIDSIRYTRIDMGTAASGMLLCQPFIKDFSSLPGGGLLVAPSPLYMAIKGTSAGQAGQANMRMYYTYIEMAADEYWQLVESRRVIST